MNQSVQMVRIVLTIEIENQSQSPSPNPPSDPSAILSPGFSLPAFERRAQHPGAGWLPGQAEPGEGGPGPRPRGAEEDPRLPGPVSSHVPVRPEPAPSHRVQGGHDAHGGLDLRLACAFRCWPAEISLLPFWDKTAARPVQTITV